MLARALTGVVFEIYQHEHVKDLLIHGLTFYCGDFSSMASLCFHHGGR